MLLVSRHHSHAHLLSLTLITHTGARALSPSHTRASSHPPSPVSSLTRRRCAPTDTSTISHATLSFNMARYVEHRALVAMPAMCASLTPMRRVSWRDPCYPAAACWASRCEPSRCGCVQARRATSLPQRLLWATSVSNRRSSPFSPHPRWSSSSCRVGRLTRVAPCRAVPCR
jgi:hypothetical protein